MIFYIKNAQILPVLYSISSAYYFQLSGHAAGLQTFQKNLSNYVFLFHITGHLGTGIKQSELFFLLKKGYSNYYIISNRSTAPLLEVCGHNCLSDFEGFPNQIIIRRPANALGSGIAAFGFL